MVTYFWYFLFPSDVKLPVFLLNSVGISRMQLQNSNSCMHLYLRFVPFFSQQKVSKKIKIKIEKELPLSNFGSVHDPFDLMFVVIIWTQVSLIQLAYAELEGLLAVIVIPFYYYKQYLALSVAIFLKFFITFYINLMQ